jgi:hypothetical protein
MKKLENMSHLDSQVIKRSVVEIEEVRTEKISTVTQDRKYDVESVLYPQLKEKKNKFKESSNISKIFHK